MQTRRRFVFAHDGDTLVDIAARAFPDDTATAQQVPSWNLHLAYRRSPTDDPARLLPTDIVYLEPPLP